MAHSIGFVDNSGGTLAHNAFLDRLRDQAELAGWAVLRHVDHSENHELILRGPGLTGLEQIFVGFRTYQDVQADIYNITAGVFTGYSPDHDFDKQPGAYYASLAADDERVDYWITLNPQRIAFVLKVGGSVYEHCYVGKFLPYGRPAQYPYPVVCAGMLKANARQRYSSEAGTHTLPYGRSRSDGLALRNNQDWVLPYCYPWGSKLAESETGSKVRDTEGRYPLFPVELHDNSSNLWGCLDGIHQITGRNNNSENTLTIDGVTHVVFQGAHRTGFLDFFTMRLDP